MIKRIFSFLVCVIAMALFYPDKSAFSFTIKDVHYTNIDPIQTPNYPGPIQRWALYKPVDGKIKDGKVLFKINPNGMTVFPDFSIVEETIKKAAYAWQDVQNTSFKIEYDGTTWEDVNDNKFNVLIWETDKTYHKDPTVLAKTYVDCNVETGEITQACIIFNGNEYLFTKLEWTTDPITRGEFNKARSNGFTLVNLQAVATHEFGHFLRLGESSINGATMFLKIPDGPDQNNLFSLEADDKAGVSYLYPGDNYYENFGDGKAQNWRPVRCSWSVVNKMYGAFNPSPTGPTPAVSTYNGGIFEDFEYQVDFKQQVPGYPTYIIFRATSDCSYANQTGSGYAFGFVDIPSENIRGYWMHKMYNGVPTQITNGWVWDHTIERSYTQWNTVNVISNGNVFSLYLNGKWVYTFTDAINPIPYGRIGLVGISNYDQNMITHYFDNISVTIK